MENIEEKKGDTILIDVIGFITWKSFMHIIIKHCEEGKNTKVVFDRPQVPVTNSKGSMHATAFGNSSAIGSIKDVVKVEDRNARAIIENIM